MKAKIIITALTALFLASCVNTNIPEHLKNNTKKDKPVTPPKDSELGKSVLVKNALLNLEYKVGKNCDETRKEFTFDLDTGKFLTEDKLFSSEWEFELTSSKYIIVNNSNGVTYRICTDGKLGEEQSPKGNVLCTLVPKSFDEVTEAPNPLDYEYNVFRDLKGKIITAPNSIITGKRYHYYQEYRNAGYRVTDIGYFGHNNIVGVADNFGDGVREVFPDRTFIFKTSEGNYAKLQILCLYKDCPKPEEIKSIQKLAITFRYFVQKDGSRNLNHKE